MYHNHRDLSLFHLRGVYVTLLDPLQVIILDSACIISVSLSILFSKVVLVILGHSSFYVSLRVKLSVSIKISAKILILIVLNL